MFGNCFSVLLQRNADLACQHAGVAVAWTPLLFSLLLCCYFYYNFVWIFGSFLLDACLFRISCHIRVVDGLRQRGNVNFCCCCLVAWLLLLLLLLLAFYQLMCLVICIVAIICFWARAQFFSFNFFLYTMWLLLLLFRLCFGICGMRVAATVARYLCRNIVRAAAVWTTCPCTPIHIHTYTNPCMFVCMYVCMHICLFFRLHKICAILPLSTVAQNVHLHICVVHMSRLPQMACGECKSPQI